MNFIHFLRVIIITNVFFLALSSALHASLPDGNSIRLQLPDKTHATIKMQDNNVIAQLQNGTHFVLVNNLNNIPEYARDIWIADFDFDGHQDVAITTEVDPVSNDQFYTIFAWEASLRQFVPEHFVGGLSNLEIDPQSKQIRSSYQDGDFWTEDTYRFINQQPFLYSKSVLVASNFWYTTIYSAQGQVIRSLVSNSGKTNSPPEPVLLVVSDETVPLYRQPLPSTRLNEQLARGTVVTVIDFKRGPGRFYWVNIRANLHNKILQGWTLLSNLVQG